MFLVLTGLCAACVPPSAYHVITEKAYLSDLPRQKKLFLVDARHLPDIKLLNHLNRNEWESFDAKIGAVKDEPTRVLLRSVRLLKEKNYLASYQVMANYPDAWQDCQALMLKTDCLHELKVDSVDVRARYQQAFDCTSNQTVKSIAKTRFRFVNYGR